MALSLAVSLGLFYSKTIFRYENLPKDPTCAFVDPKSRGVDIASASDHFVGLQKYALLL